MYMILISKIKGKKQILDLQSANMPLKLKKLGFKCTNLIYEI